MADDSKAKTQKFNEALNDPHQFKSFAADPAGFAQKHGVTIDPALSDQLASKLKGHNSLAEVQAKPAGGGNFTAAAVALGAFAHTDTKIGAVAI
jgi:hypothetical protein